MGLLLLLTGMLAGQVRADSYASHAPADVIQAAVARARQAYTNALERVQQTPANPVAAWQLARACFDCADLADNNPQRAWFAERGMRAARQAIALNPKLAAAYYYLGLNQGQLARTRKLTALGLLDDIEAAWTKATQLDPLFDYSGPHRSLGILYRDAPGWPLSLGSRAKARKHLELAVKLAPGYPDNQISLLESYLDWGEKKRVQTRLPATRKLLQTARTQLTGDFWELSWHDWDRRWKTIESKFKGKSLASPRADDSK